MNNALIDEAIAILQTMNMEDCAAEIQKLRADLIRSQGTANALRNLAGQLATELAQLEDDPRRLEDSDDETDI